MLPIGSNTDAQLVEFDVALYVEKESETKAGLGVFVASLGIGANGKSPSGDSTLSRVKFKVPLALPTPP